MRASTPGWGHKRLAAGVLCALAAASTAQAQLSAGATRLHVVGVECRNLSTGSAVRATDSGTEWDCVDLGLGVETGDRVAISVRGRVPSEPPSSAPQPGPGISSVAPLLVESVVSDQGDLNAAAGDLDLDGDQDLILEDNFRWLEFVTDDPPTFVEHDLVGREGDARGVLALDVDGDGRPDIVASFRGNSNAISWHENMPGDPPVFLEHPLYKEEGWQPQDLEGGDFDRDGDEDIVNATIQLDGDLARLVWLENDGTGRFAPRVIYEVEAPSISTISFEVGDLDGDDDLDVFAAVINLGLVWVENDGAADPSWQSHPMDEGFVPTGVGLGDFDRDGDLDAVAGYDSILFQRGEFEELRLYENVDGRFDQIEVHSLGLFEGGIEPTVVDLNADGWLDLFLPTNTTSLEGFHWLENRGGLVFEEHLPLYVNELVPWNRPLVVDLGEDGDVDIVGEPQVAGPDPTARVEARMTLGGWALGMTLDRLRCRNLTTGQSVSSSNPTGAAFSCEALGLSVSPGDFVLTQLRGVAE